MVDDGRMVGSARASFRGEADVKAAKINKLLAEMHATTFNATDILRVLREDPGQKEIDLQVANSRIETGNEDNGNVGIRDKASSNRSELTPQLTFPSRFRKNAKKTSLSPTHSLLETILLQLRSGLVSEVKIALNSLTIISFESTRTRQQKPDSSISPWNLLSADIGLKDVDLFLPAILKEIFTIVAKPLVMEIEDKKSMSFKRGEKFNELCIIVDELVQDGIDIRDYHRILHRSANNNGMSSSADSNLFARDESWDDVLTCCVCGANVLRNFSSLLQASLYGASESSGSFPQSNFQLSTLLQKCFTDIHAVSVMSLLLCEWPDNIDEDPETVNAMMDFTKNVCQFINLKNCSYYKQDCSCYNACSINYDHIQGESTVAMKLLRGLFYRTTNEESSDLIVATALHCIESLLFQRCGFLLWRFLNDNYMVLSKIVYSCLQSNSCYRVEGILRFLDRLIQADGYNLGYPAGYGRLFIADDARILYEIVALTVKEDRISELINLEDIADNKTWTIIDFAANVLMKLSLKPHSRMSLLQFESMILEGITSPFFSKCERACRMLLSTLQNLSIIPTICTGGA